MTNEEKAKEYSQIQIADTVTERRIKEAYLNACEWKDQQFKEYLEKKMNEYIDTHKEGDLLLDYASCIDRIINELFSKTEQDNSDRED